MKAIKPVILLFCLLLFSCNINNTFSASSSQETNEKNSYETSSTNKEIIDKMFITINNKKEKITLESNSSVNALIEILKQNDIIYTADDYGGFEKVGYIGYNLPTNNTQITTEPGDVILYQGNQICLFVGSNSWSYTKIGKIQDLTDLELKDFLNAGKGEIEIKLSLK